MAQALRVINGVRPVFRGPRRSTADRDSPRAFPTERRRRADHRGDLANVGQANEPDLLQAHVEARRARVVLGTRRTATAGAGRTSSPLSGGTELRPDSARPAAARRRGLAADFEPARWPTCFQRSPEIQAALPRFVAARSWCGASEPSRSRTSPYRPSSAATTSSASRPRGPGGVPLPIFNRNQGTVREAQADLARDHAEHERVALSLATAPGRRRDPLQRRFAIGGGLPGRDPAAGAGAAYEVQSTNFRPRRGRVASGARRPADLRRAENKTMSSRCSNSARRRWR